MSGSSGDDRGGRGGEGGGAPLVLGAGPLAAPGADESLITYPSELTVKAIGENAEIDGVGLPELVESLVRPLLAPAEPAGVEAIPSSGGKYVSVRVRFTATSRAQLEAVYGALHVEPRVLQTL